MKDKISCITITKNRIHLLKRCIRFFIEQTHNNKELLILYYDTDDDTIEYLNNNRTFLTDNNIRTFKFVDNPQIYTGSLRNYLIKKSVGDYICIFDDDDYHHPNRLTEQYNYIKENNLDGCTIKSILVYSLKYQDFKESFGRSEGWEGTLMCHKSVIPLYKNLKRYEDTPVVTYLFLNHSMMTYDNSSLYIYVLHYGNTSSNKHKEDLFNNSSIINIPNYKMWSKLW